MVSHEFSIYSFTLQRISVIHILIWKIGPGCYNSYRTPLSRAAPILMQSLATWAFFAIALCLLCGPHYTFSPSVRLSVQYGLVTRNQGNTAKSKLAQKFPKARVSGVFSVEKVKGQGHRTCNLQNLASCQYRSSDWLWRPPPKWPILCRVGR